ncbi:hypothetical protein NGB36_02060 [Streptomyces sp. RB6PN25]|uniref:Lipoprotein n=1 Tax=Streptomyces humicola TaxID=2953240 RepID=A0ABT1PP16_9ACTN|nr:hypothetical protein [Streptomyces humicola]MCQ4079414.1 hypothetical protein [Streptomyces humicola]
MRGSVVAAGCTVSASAWSGRIEAAHFLVGQVEVDRAADTALAELEGPARQVLDTGVLLFPNPIGLPRPVRTGGTSVDGLLPAPAVTAECHGDDSGAGLPSGESAAPPDSAYAGATDVLGAWGGRPGQCVLCQPLVKGLALGFPLPEIFGSFTFAGETP